MFGRVFVTALVMIGAGGAAGPAWAQPEDLNRGKSPAQLFASDCSGCHRSPRGLAKREGGSLASFLRVHYTASRESAAALAAYLAAQAPDPRAGTRPAARTAPARPSGPPKDTAQPAKANEAAKPSEPVEAAPAAATPPPAAAAAPSVPQQPAANPQ